MNIINDLDVFIELVPDLAFFKNMKGEHTHFNTLFLEFIQKSREAVVNKTDFEIYSKESAVKFRKDDEAILANNKTRTFEDTFIKDDGSKIYFYITKKIIYDDAGVQLGLFCVARDITPKKEYEFIYEDNQKILEYITRHNDLIKNLDKIVHLAEYRNRNSKCSILLLSENKKNLLSGSAPSLPDFYNEAIDGIEIGEKVGSCGSATFKQERVIVEDIDTHENWQPYLALTQKANLHACWSEPIFSSKNEILGSFAIYSDEAKTPTDFELRLINSYAHLASVAIEKENNSRALKDKELKILKQTEESNIKLKQSKHELLQLFDNALVGLMYINSDRILVKGNQHLADMFGYETSKEMIGISMRQLHLSQQRFIEFGRKNFYTLIHKENLNIEYLLQKKDGSAMWCELSGKALDENNPADLSKGVLWTLRDISKKKELEEKVKERTEEIENKNEQLKDLAAKDYLTGLFNRSKLDEALEYQIKRSKRYKNSFGVIMMDIDYFKIVNDKYGHQVGDAVLCEFADLLTGTSRETDIVGRWGGEEFLIIVENIDKNGIIKLAEKLRVAIEVHNFSIIKQKTASFGAAIYNVDDKINELISRADKALYEAKNSGRNRVKFL